MNVFKIIAESFKYLYEEFFLLGLMSIVTWLATALILPGPFAQAGLWYVTHRTLEDQAVTWKDFWEGAKTYGPRNWANTLIIALGYLLVLVNLRFYSLPEYLPISEEVAVWISAAWVAVGLLWTAIAFYLLAFQLRMVEAKLWLSLRNSLFLALVRPLQTLTFLVLLGGFVYLCLRFPMILPLLILLPALGAVLSVNAVRRLVEPIIT